jgi:two-component system response regulator MprA
VRVLIVDDEPAVRGSLARAMRIDGHDVRVAANGCEGLDALLAEPVDVVVLDLQMPGMDGLEMCRRMRSGGDRTPVLVLTARTSVAQRVEGLDAGADDYLVKPFALDELRARLRALRRRVDPAADGSSVLRYRDLSLDLATRRASRGDRQIDDLTRLEFALVELLLRHPEVVLSRPEIFDRVWGYDFGGGSSSLEVYVGYVRRKLEAAGEPRLVQTVRGVGYVLRADP